MVTVYGVLGSSVASVKIFFLTISSIDSLDKMVAVVTYLPSSLVVKASLKSYGGTVPPSFKTLTFSFGSLEFWSSGVTKMLCNLPPSSTDGFLYSINSLVTSSNSSTVSQCSTIGFGSVGESFSISSSVFGSSGFKTEIILTM